MMVLANTAVASAAPAVDCRPAVHIATTASAAPRGGAAVQDLVWDTTVACQVHISDDATWFDVRFAYPLPEGSELVDTRNGTRRAIERDGRLVGVSIYQEERIGARTIAFSIRTRNVGRGADARITPPLLDREEPQVVAFSNGDLSFEPRESLGPQSRTTAMAITLGDLSHQAYRAALNEEKYLGLRWGGPALVLRVTRPIREHQGLDGELVERAEKTQGVFIGVSIAVAAAVVGLAYVALRFKRRSDDEHAEATLRAEIDSL